MFAKAFPNAARGENVAIALEGLYSLGKIKPPTSLMPREAAEGILSRHISTEWPIHKSWFVPTVDSGEPRVLVDPPKRLVRYIGRDVEGTYLHLLKVGLEELRDLAFRGQKPTYLSGWEIFRDVELEIAARLFRLLDSPQFARTAIETLLEVDFIIVDGGIYHVEVKTTQTPTDQKLRKKWLLLKRRQEVLEKLGMRPALAVVIPKENWEVEIELVKEKAIRPL